MVSSVDGLAGAAAVGSSGAVAASRSWLAYGAGIFVVMNYVVVPLSEIGRIQTR